ncbi:hypothetical protein [Persicitalea jodogahamensis]|uniref:Lipoprotein n=1 Tax=Persicitalea jodogahamensis TaxID=402147 RepID=A0A8J3GAK1_9BACT|nr:hypothetical protein [Persicitalea jodogahamensis]GHB70807.1 hypothetical protein GCM10007390_25660 [Persicitalea jodogahamensis]
MKIKHWAGLALLSVQAAIFTGCDSTADQKKTPNSEMNDVTKTGADESRAAMGVGEGNQDETGGYPANQGNLYPDSTRRDTNDIRRPR